MSDKFLGPISTHRQQQQRQALFSFKFPHVGVLHEYISFHTGDPVPINIGTI